MFGWFELKTKYVYLPKNLKDYFSHAFKSKYETQNIIKPTDPVLVIKNEGKMKTSLFSWVFISPLVKNPLYKSKRRPFNYRSETVEENKLFHSSSV